MSDHTDRRDRVAVVLSYTQVITKTHLKSLITWLKARLPEELMDDLFAEVHAAMGYLTSIDDIYLKFYARPAFATKIEQAAGNGNLPPGVTLERVEWPGQEPEGGWAPITFQGVDGEGNPITCQLPAFT